MHPIIGALVTAATVAPTLLAADVTPTIVDFSFHCALGPEWGINVTRPLPDGKVLVGGYGDSRPDSKRVVRLNQDGSVDASFQSTLSQPVGDCLVLPDGGIIAGTRAQYWATVTGGFSAEHVRISIYLLATNGLTLRTLFTKSTTNLTGWISWSIAPLANGGFLLHTATPTNALYRFDGPGLNQTQLQFPATDSSRWVSTLASDPEGRILIAGRIYREAGADVRPWVWRLNADGTLDETFQRQEPPASNYGDIDGLIVQDDGKVIVSGFFSSFANRPAPAIARLNADGTFDESFHLATFDDAPLWSNSLLPRRKVVPLPDGTGLVSGRFSDNVHASVPGFYHVSRDGQLLRALMLDAGFVPFYLDGAEVAHDGHLLLRAYFNGDPEPLRLIRVFADGRPRAAVGFDSPWTVNTSEFESSVTLRLRRFGDPAAAFSVRLVATDATAKAGEHYQLLTNEVRFAPGELLKSVSITLFDDGHVSGGKEFEVSISGRSDGIFRAPLQQASIRVDERDYPSTVDLSFNPAAELSIQPVNCYECSPDGLDRLRVDSHGRIVTGWIEFPTPVRVDGLVTYMGTARRLLRFNEDGSLHDKADFIFDDAPNQQLFFEVFKDLLFLVGRFQRTDGSLSPLLSRLNPDFTQDPTFAPEFLQNDTIQTVTIDSHGRVLVAGRTGDGGGWLRRLLDDGSVDASFTNRAALYDGVSGIALQTTGKIVLSYLDPNRPMTRLNEDGTVDSSFRIEPTVSQWLPSEVTVGTDDRIYIASLDGAYRLNADGRLDPSFETPKGSYRAKPLLQNDGKILLSGDLITPDNEIVRGLLRLNPNGTIDSAFTPIRVPGWGISIRDMTLDLQGRVLVAGNFSRLEGVRSPGLARLNSTTSQPRIGFARAQFLAREGESAVITIERSTDLRGTATVGYRLEAGTAGAEDFLPQTGTVEFAPMQRTGVIRVPVKSDGSFESTETAQLEITELPPGTTPGILRATVYLLDAEAEDEGIDLTLDAPLDEAGPGLILGFRSAGTQPDGRILVTNGSEVRRLTQPGREDSTFKPFDFAAPDGAILTALKDGRMLARQNSTVIKLLADGAIDTGFQPIAVPSGIAGILLTAESEDFYLYGPQLLARYQSNGTVDATFAAALRKPSDAWGGSVERLIRQRDGKLMVKWSYGRFLPWGPPTTEFLRLKADGSPDSTFALDPALAGSPDLLAVLWDGAMIVSESSGDVLRLRRTDPSGQVDPSFGSPDFRLGGWSPGQINTVLEQPDGKLLVAGTFDRMNELPRTGVARLHPDGSPDASFDAHLAAVIGQLDAGITGLREAGPGEYLLDLLFPEGPARNRDGFLRFRSESAPRFEWIGRAATITHLRLLRGSRKRITIERSLDFKEWVPLPASLDSQNAVVFEDGQSLGRRFYRARTVDR